MTTTMTTDLELLRTRVTGAIGGQMPGQIQRLGWPAGRLAAWRRDRLRTLLARAIEHSPFHAARLRGIDPSRFELAVIGAPLLHAPAVREFQIRQIERGADVAAVIDGDLEETAVTTAVREGLRRAGLADPQVFLRRVGALDRDPLTGKARRFIPLRTGQAGTS
jgi:hypothetical protein